MQSSTFPRRHRRGGRRGSRRQLFHYVIIAASSSLLCDVSTNNNTALMVQCLLMPPKQQRSVIPFNMRRMMLNPIIIKQHIHEHKYKVPQRRRALHLFSFDKFLFPYGVNQTTDDSNDKEEYQIELLNALLPKALTTDDKRRVIEGFQRALLDEQLRQSRRRGGNNNNDDDVGNQFLADDEDMVSSMSDIFQRARLSEQLRLSKNKGVYDASANYNEEDDIMSLSDDEIDKDEAFQRALLEERLKSRRIQRDKQLEQLTATIINANSIERAMMEFEEESKQHQMVTAMVHENEENEQVEDDNNDKSRHEEDIANDAIIVSNSSGARNNYDDNNNVVYGDKLLVNETEGSSPSQHLDEKLSKLYEMVAVAASSSPSSSLEEGRTVTRKSLQTFLSTTYLPLPPREDASPLSLVLAPFAHLMTSIFLLGTAVFYAAMAVLDVIWNDTITRSILRETSSVLKGCWGYVFPKSGRMKMKERPAQRTMKGMQTSIIALFYAVQCIIVRGYYHSKHSNECLDACTGSLRYSVYSSQSVKVIWTRIISTLRRKKQSIESQNAGARHTMQLWPRRLFTNMKGMLSYKKLRGSIQSEQQVQTPSSDELYNQRMRLNQDRVALERDKHQLEEDRRKLLAESMNIVAWYSAVAKEATAEEETVGKKHWWNRKS